jgi:FKBP-type peptidyl-prolyl cis-trans isomerase
MKRTLVLALALTSLLSACGGDNGQETVGQSSPTPTASGGACTPSGSGTTDLTKKPVVTTPTTPAPPTTTVIDVVCGTGAEATDGTNVKVKYLGVLYADGKEFDSSWSRGADETLPFQVGGQVIPGFSKGTQGMKVGGRREVIIPPADGYGAQGAPPDIPPNATLIFVIDLVSVG